tara:strand:- start:407 stop:775 length:369 start_codon:yes stop_codon:yes gene_type:complete
MKKYLEILETISDSKVAKKYILLGSLAICLVVIGRLSANDPIRAEFCKREILTADSLKQKNDLLKSSIIDLESQISKIQKDRYKKEVELTETERKGCNIRIANKIKSVKKLYLDAKCKICKK